MSDNAPAAPKGGKQAPKVAKKGEKRAGKKGGKIGGSWLSSYSPVVLGLSSFWRRYLLVQI